MLRPQQYGLLCRGYGRGRRSSPNHQVELRNDHILIDRSGPATFRELSNIVVKQKWAFSESACLLCLDGELKSAEEINQIALEPLFFG